MNIIVRKQDVLLVKIFYIYQGEDYDDKVFYRKVKIRAGDKAEFITDTPGAKIVRICVEGLDGIS